MAALIPAAHTGQQCSPLNNPNIPMEKHQDAEEMWRAEVTGESPRVRHLRRWLKLLPREPRCKLCNAPFHRLGRPTAAPPGRQPLKKKPRVFNYFETIVPD